MNMTRFTTLLIIFVVVLGSKISFAEPVKYLFGKQLIATDRPAQPYGSYARGCADGLVKLPETGATWQTMRLSRNRNWGHPNLVKTLTNLSKKAKEYGWNGLYFGDISQPRGGPMLSGHRSHQLGLDADIWLMPKLKFNYTIEEREKVLPQSMSKMNGAMVNNQWSKTHHKIIRAISKDDNVARIFIFPGAKVKMCRDEKGNRDWLRKVRPWWGHIYHFHVRINCPEGAEGCRSQFPPPSGDGCLEAEDWVKKIFNPPPLKRSRPKVQPRAEILLSDLPKACSEILTID
jgi:penicillin-insensitive murein endopeptidase